MLEHSSQVREGGWNVVKLLSNTVKHPRVLAQDQILAINSAKQAFLLSFTYPQSPMRLNIILTM